MYDIETCKCDFCDVLYLLEDIIEFDGLFYCNSPQCLDALERHEIEGPTVRETD